MSLSFGAQVASTAAVGSRAAGERRGVDAGGAAVAERSSCAREAPPGPAAVRVGIARRFSMMVGEAHPTRLLTPASGTAAVEQVDGEEKCCQRSGLGDRGCARRR